MSPLMVVSHQPVPAVLGLRDAGLTARTMETGAAAASALLEAPQDQAPLMLLLDADPLDVTSLGLLLELRRHPRLKYMTIVLLHGPSTTATPEAFLTARKPRDRQGYKELGLRLRRLLPLRS